MEWLRKHADSVPVIVIVVGAIYWQTKALESLFDDIEKEWPSS